MNFQWSIMMSIISILINIICYLGACSQLKKMDNIILTRKENLNMKRSLPKTPPKNYGLVFCFLTIYQYSSNLLESRLFFLIDNFIYQENRITAKIIKFIKKFSCVIMIENDKERGRLRD